MSRKIDENIVEMRFENGQFERAANTSLKTLQNLKSSLNFKGAEKGFEEVAESAKKLDFSTITSGIETVKSKFSALEVMGVTALANITNSAINTGKRLVSALTVDNISAGWTKLEQKTTSVGTLISQGYDMKTVEEQLSRLNWFTDETSYNFVAMVDSISKFTASGKKLDESTTALMGIANWAALSGQNANTASRAMYQLSQAMGAGVMRKEDYKSIQNASMDTDEFRQKCLDAGVALGTLKKNADGTYDSLMNVSTSKKKTKDTSFTKAQFADHLTEDAWLTSDVMMKVFTDYSAAVDQIYEYSSEKGITASEAIEELGDQVDEFGLKAFRAAQEAKSWTDVVDSIKDAVSTGWMTTFEAIFGNYEEQRVLWTDLANAMYDVFAASAEGRNEMLSGWKELGGRTALIEAFWNVWNSGVEILDTVKETFREIFPRTTAEQLFKITEKIRDFTAKLALNEERTQKLKTALKGLFSVIKVVYDTIKTVVSFVYSLAKNLTWVADAALDAASAIGEWLGGVSDSAAKSGFLNKVLTELGNILVFIFDKIKSLVTAIRSVDWTWLSSVFGAVVGIIQWVIGKIGELYDAVKEKLCSPELKTFGQQLVGVVQWVYDKIKETFEAIEQLFSSSGIDSATSVIGKIYGFLIKFGGVVVDLGKKIGAAVGEAFKNGDISNVLDLVNGGLFAAILSNIKKFTSGITGAFDNFSGILGGIKDVLGGVKDALEVWQKNIQSGTILKIAQAIAILAASLLVLSLIDSDKLTGALTSMTLMFAKLAMSIKILGKGKFAFSGIAKMCGFMISLSASMLILSFAMKKLGSLDWEGVAKGAVGVTTLALTISAAAKMLSTIDGKVIKGASSMIIFASAVAILASIAKKLASLELPKLIQGMASVTALTVMMTVVSKSLSKIDGKIVKGAGSLIIFASAVAVMASVCNSLSKMDLSALAKGAVGLAAVSAVALISAKALSKIDGRIVKGAASLVIFSSAVAILAEVCKNLSGLQWEELGKGLAGIAGITAALIVVSKVKTSIAKGAASFVIVGAALTVITEVIKKLGGMETKQLAVGFGAFAGSLLVLAVGLKAMKNSVKGAAALAIAVSALAPLTLELKVLSSIKMSGIASALIALAGTFVVLSVATKRLKPIAGTMVKVAGAVSLFGAGCALAGTGILAVSVALTSLSVSLIAMGSSLGIMLANLFDGISASASAFGNMATEIAKALCTALKETAPALVDTLLTVILEVLKALANDAPQIVDTACDLITTIIDKLAVKIPKIVNTVAKLLKQVADTLNQNLGENGWEKLILSITAIAGVLLAIAAIAKIIPSIQFDGILTGLKGLAATVGGIIVVAGVFGALAQIPGFVGIMESSAAIFAALGKAIGAIISGLISGVVDNFPKDLDAVLNACVGIEAIALAIAPLSEILGDLDITGTAKGMASFAIIVGGLAAILAALGGLKQIPGFEDIVDAGGSVLCKIAEILGEIVGSFVDNLAKSVTSSIAEVVNSLVSIGTVLTAVAGIAKIVGKLKISPAAVAEGFAGVAVAIGCIALILAALGGIKQIPGVEWIVGEGGKLLCQIGSILGEVVGSIISGLGVGLTSGLKQIGQNLSDFMTTVTPFIDGVKKVDSSVMSGVGALAGSILALTAANLLDGIASFLLGGRSIDKFGKQIATFGESLKAFSDNVTGINESAVEAAAKAGESLARMTHTIPSSGGVAQFFAGEKSLAKFSKEIGTFGEAISAFSDKVANVKPDVVETAAKAGEALANMTHTIPRSDGVTQFFAGNQSLAKFSKEIEDFGCAISAFSDKVANVKTAPVEAAAKAGQALAEMTNTIPNTDGVEQFFTGTKSLARFSTEICLFGKGIAAFAKSAPNSNLPNAEKAAGIGKIIAEMTQTIPNGDGIAQFFAGGQSLSKFSGELGNFGKGISEFAANINVNDSDIAKAGTAAEIGKKLAEMTKTIPEEKGVAQFFSGEKSLASFSEGIGKFGEGITKFAKNVEGMPDDTTKVEAAAAAGKALAEMTNTIPKSDGVEQWFTGTASLSKFGDDIENLGTALSKFSVAVKDVEKDKVEAATEAATAIANMTTILPDMGGVAQFFAGNKDLNKFGTALGNLGDSVLTFSTKVANIDAYRVKNAAEASKTIAEAMNIATDSGSDKLGNVVAGVAGGISYFVNTLDKIDINDATAKLLNLAAISDKIQNGGLDGFSKLSEALAKAAQEGIQAFADAFEDKDDTAKNAVSAFAAKASAKTIEYKPKYTEAGKMMAKGFGDGLVSGSDYVNQCVSNLAAEALNTIRRVLNIHSPSKETFKIGTFFGTGFAGGISGSGEQVENASEGLAEKATSGLNSVISKVTDFIGGKIDVQPTITPVLDLSDVETKSKSIDAMFSREQAVSVNAGIAANNSANSSDSSSSSSNFTFTQNITSPKAVDAKTIYRQTRNQFARMMEAISRV